MTLRILFYRGTDTRPAAGRIGGTGAPGGGSLIKAEHRLALVRSKPSNVDQPGYLGIVASFRDDDPTIGMADENDRSILGCKRPLRYCQSPASEKVGFWTIVTA